MIVDTHLHVIADDADLYPLRSDVHTADTAWYLDTGMTASAMAQVMAAAGVGRGMLVQPGIAYGEDNSYLIDSLSTHPHQFVGVCGVLNAPIHPESAVALLEGPGVVSLRLFDNGLGILADHQTHDLAEHLAVIKSPLVIAGNPSSVPLVRALAESVPEINIVLDHGAIDQSGKEPEPWRAGTSLHDLAQTPNIFIKVTPVLIAQTPPDKLSAAGEALSLLFGIDRLLWGSDFSHSVGPYDAIVAQAESLVSGLVDSDRAAFLGGTAERLWPEIRQTM